jgi:hypothetical protein
MQHREFKKGFIVLLSTLILAMIGGMLILSLYDEQIGGTQITSLRNNDYLANALTLSCVEQSIYEVSILPNTIVNNQKLEQGNGYCLYSILGNNNLKEINVESNINNSVIKNTKVFIDRNNLNQNNKIKIISWQEI